MHISAQRQRGYPSSTPPFSARPGRALDHRCQPALRLGMLEALSSASSRPSRDLEIRLEGCHADAPSRLGNGSSSRSPRKVNRSMLYMYGVRFLHDRSHGRTELSHMYNLPMQFTISHPYIEHKASLSSLHSFIVERFGDRRRASIVGNSSPPLLIFLLYDLDSSQISNKALKMIGSILAPRARSAAAPLGADLRQQLFAGPSSTSCPFAVFVLLETCEIVFWTGTEGRYDAWLWSTLREWWKWT